MDPNEALKRCREAAKITKPDYLSTKSTWIRAAYELSDTFDALDAWLMRGGFLPADWEKARSPK